MTTLQSLLLRAVRSLSDGSGSFVPRMSSRRPENAHSRCDQGRWASTRTSSPIRETPLQCPTIHVLTVEPLDRLGLRGRGHPTKPNRPRAPGVTVHPDDPTDLSESLAQPFAGRREADPEKARRDDC
jgi:hypothetical protein